MSFKSVFIGTTFGLALIACTPAAPSENLEAPENALPGLQHELIVDDWSGMLKLPGSTELLLVFHISEDEAGELAITMDSPDQGAVGIPGENARIEGDMFKADFPGVGGSFQMKPAEDDRMIGTWIQGLPLPITLTRGDLTPERLRPQEPAERPYEIEEVSFSGGADEVVLAGELTYPGGEGSYPGLILISGSGPQDRNEEMMQHKPFLILSDYLTRRGYAVLRYDDRGTAESTGDFSTATTEDFATDAAAAFRFLAGNDRIDAARIAYVGHSEGGLVGPLAAYEESPAAMVLLAGPSVTLADVLYQQTGDLMRAEGIASNVQIELFQSNTLKVLDAIRQTDTLDEAKIQARETLQGSGIPATAIDAQLEQSITPWMAWVMDYDPIPALEAYDGPV
ncbi:MAG: CocE/NonD family hydrolase, partial [Pseudomonadota bacterium]